MMAIILWAHRQRLSESQTHKAPAAAVPCDGGDRRVQPTINAPRPSPFARLRRTRPTLTKIALPDRLQPKLPLLPALPLCRPYGVNTLPAGGQGRRQRRQERHQPDSLPSFAPPSSTKNKMRPAMPAPRQKAATLRRARCFGFGRFGAPHHCRCLAAGTKLPPLMGYSGPAGGPARQRPAASPAKPTQAPSRPCRKPCARPCTSPSGWLAGLVPSRKCGTAFARCASDSRRAPSLPAVVRPRPRVSDEALCTKPREKGVVVKVGQFVDESLS